MIDFFKDVFEYNHHFNKTFIEVMISTGFQNNDAKRLMNHIHQAHSIWNARLMQVKKDIDVWADHNLKDLLSTNEQNYTDSLEIILMSDFSAQLKYVNTKGTAFNNTVRDILFHIINHSTHHRAQIARVLRQEGIAPPPSDYIFYKRSDLTL